MLVVAQESAVSVACAAVLVDDGSTADRAREQSGVEIRRLIASAVGPGSWPEVITTLELVFSRSPDPPRVPHTVERVTSSSPRDASG